MGWLPFPTPFPRPPSPPPSIPPLQNRVLSTTVYLLVYADVRVRSRRHNGMCVFPGPTGFMIYITFGLVLLSCFLNPFWFRTKWKQLAARNERVAAVAAAAAAATHEGKAR